MSDTPRTEKARQEFEHQRIYGQNGIDEVALSGFDFAEILEQELNQAIKERYRFKECDEAVGALHRLMSDAGIECGHIVDRVERVVIQRDENKAGWDSCSLTALRLEQERNRAVRCLQAIQEYLAAAHEDGDTLAGIEALIHEWKVSTE